MYYYIYDETGRIKRTGSTANKKRVQQNLKAGEFFGVGKANDSKQMVVDGKLVSAQVPLCKRIPDEPITVVDTQTEDQPAHITREQWQSILERLDKLEKNNVKNKN